MSRYRLPVNLQQGELSMMILGADEGYPGDKSKVFSMQEGEDENDITDDDYRMTAELRGRNYGAPGSVTYRIIAGDGDSRDGDRSQLNFDSSRWYFWRFTWQTGSARLEVKEDGPNGELIYSRAIGTGATRTVPDPHFIHLGAPIGRGGALDATHARYHHQERLGLVAAAPGVPGRVGAVGMRTAAGNGRCDQPHLPSSHLPSDLYGPPR